MAGGRIAVGANVLQLYHCARRRRVIIDKTINNIIASDLRLGPQSTLVMTMDQLDMKAVEFMLCNPKESAPNSMDAVPSFLPYKYAN